MKLLRRGRDSRRVGRFARGLEPGGAHRARVRDPSWRHGVRHVPLDAAECARTMLYVASMLTQDTRACQCAWWRFRPRSACIGIGVAQAGSTRGCEELPERSHFVGHGRVRTYSVLSSTVQGPLAVFAVSLTVLTRPPTLSAIVKRTQTRSAPAPVCFKQRKPLGTGRQMSVLTLPPALNP